METSITPHLTAISEILFFGGGGQADGLQDLSSPTRATVSESPES